jgi:hypothetical protein
MAETPMAQGHEAPPRRDTSGAKDGPSGQPSDLAPRDAQACHKKAEALAILAVMFPENAERYRAKEQYWRNLAAEAEREAEALAKRPNTGFVG